MSHSTDEAADPTPTSDRIEETHAASTESDVQSEASEAPQVTEETPAGGLIDQPADLDAGEESSVTEEDELVEEEAETPADDEEPAPLLVWYVLKVQSSREDTIRDALVRRVKMHGLEPYFGRIVVPTEKITEIRNNKKRIVERKTYPGYIMIEMELNEKTWFLVRETPGVGDFVGAHGTPTQLPETEVNQMLGQQTATEEQAPPKVKIDVERGDRVKIKDGPFENFEGTVEEVIEGRGLVKVMLIIFNRPTPVDLEYWQVERL
jgi:transcriptional antiterminator NusG